MDPVQIATDLIVENQAAAIGLVTALFAVTIVPTLAIIGVNRAKRALVSLAGGSASLADTYPGYFHEDGSARRYRSGSGFTYNADGSPALTFSGDDDGESRYVTRRSYKAYRRAGLDRSRSKELAAETRDGWIGGR